jgi:sortase A
MNERVQSAGTAAMPRAELNESSPARTKRGRKPRVPKPPEPHDWRWFVGGLGRVLISLGLLIFAFVGYQLWGTEIQYHQSQNELEKRFQEIRATIETAPVSASTAPAPAQPTTLAPAVIDPATSLPVDAPTTTLAPVAVAPALPLINLGDPVGFISIKKIDEVSMLLAGVRTEDLKEGVGHFPDTPLPGQPGNASIAGHRTTYGAPFGNLDRLEPGDRIVIESLQGHYEYVVEGSKIVPPSDYTVVANVADRNLLTLITCNPKYTAKERLVVTAVLDEAASSPLGAPVINYGRDQADLESGDSGLATEVPSAEGQADAGVDTTLAATEAPAVSDPTAVAPSVAPTVDTTQTTDGVLIAPADSDSLDSGATGQSADAFAAGWFSDKTAWPQVALWGLACSAVSILAWLLGRKTRKWFSLLVGIAPFVVALYFFFENVNRLLPPNL